MLLALPEVSDCEKDTWASKSSKKAPVPLGTAQLVTGSETVSYDELVKSWQQAQ